MTNRDEYIAKMKLQLDELNESMNELEARANTATVNAQARYAEDISEMRYQSRQAIAKLEELKTVRAESWNALVGEMDKARDAYIHSFLYLKSHV